jgi:hypothetical protein
MDLPFSIPPYDISTKLTVASTLDSVSLVILKPAVAGNINLSPCVITLALEPGGIGTDLA